MTTPPLQRPSSRIARSARPTRMYALLATLVSVSLVLAACAGGADTDSFTGSADAGSSIASADAGELADAGAAIGSADAGERVAKGGDEVEELLAGTPVPLDRPADEPTPATGASSIARQIEFIGNAAGLPDEPAGPSPVSISLPSLGVDGAPVSSVGVEANGDMEIPGASDVGWYRFGPRPGDTGSAVLAAHIAFDGEDGVFRDLADMEPGERFSVSFDDGSSREFVAIGLRQYSKTDIPLDEFFSRDGTPRLVLITCGGRFNRALQSYDDNVVVISIPVDLGQTTRS